VAWDASDQARLSVGQLAEVRKRKLEATQRLLGDTIALSELAWQEPSRLPGWTRAHVASHLSRNADALCRAVDLALMGRRALMYDSDEDRDLAIERGSERSGLELQIDLDTSAGRLNHRFNVLETLPPDMLLELTPGNLYRADLLPLVRLNEIVLHHIDLDCGFEVTDIDPEPARWLLELNAMRHPLEGLVRGIHLESESGFVHDIGPQQAAVTVGGPDAVVLGWLTGRLRPADGEALGLPEEPRPR